MSCWLFVRCSSVTERDDGCGTCGNHVLAVFRRLHTLFVRAALDGGRADLAERRTSTPLVIEHLNVVEQLQLGLGATGEAIRRLALTDEKNASMTALS